MRATLGGRLVVPDSWTVATVDDIKSPEPNSCRSGPFGSSISRKYFVDEGIPVIRGGNLRADMTRFVPEGFVYVSEERAREKYSACLVEAGDLVVTCWGTIGQVGIIPDDGPFDRYVISNKQLKLRVDRERVDPLFLFYQLSSPDGVAYINSRAKGTAVPGINLGILKSIEVALPPLQVQGSIARILSAYDDLIENNNRRMALLEESIHLLYREWFVYLRFPGHERVEVVDGVPEGWSRTTMGELCEVFDGPHATPKPAEEGPVFLGIKNITPDGRLDLSKIRHISEAEYPRWTKRVTPQAGDVVFTYEATLHRYAVIPNGFRGCLGRRMGLLRPRRDDVTASFLFPMLRSPTWRAYMETQKLHGATVDRISIKKFPSFRVLVPHKTVLVEFVAAAQSVLAQRSNLREQNRKLSEARDILLPRLMDGRIPV